MGAMLLHWWRLLVEPTSGLVGVGPKRWRVRYRETVQGGCVIPSGVSIGLAYTTACDYAHMWNGTVERNV